ncbi:hypothetical protein E2C01_095576 [Portunus trituberculatus]|uniref:Uncharacterized protein n=1 Tax=Portunus trituberculatus TaxID=210409 RepID=A0A5B7K0I8_PORTR|nr:hypothetical protein [Portunus trituberculatus]
MTWRCLALNHRSSSTRAEQTARHHLMMLPIFVQDSIIYTAIMSNGKGKLSLRFADVCFYIQKASGHYDGVVRK